MENQTYNQTVVLDRLEGIDPGTPADEVRDRLGDPAVEREGYWVYLPGRGHGHIIPRALVLRFDADDLYLGHHTANPDLAAELAADPTPGASE
jgi:hypothetical protein